MSIVTWDIQKIGIFLLLPAFVFVAIILPCAGPPGVAADAVTLIFTLQVLCAIIIFAQEPVCTGFRLGIVSRSPPNR